MLRDKFIQGHWDTMDEKSKQIYLEQRTVQIVVKALVFMCIATLLGGIALEPSCERADTETAKQAVESAKISMAVEKVEAGQPSYHMRHAYETCVEKCFSSRTDKKGDCPQHCGASVKMLMMSSEDFEAEGVDLKDFFDKPERR